VGQMRPRWRARKYTSTVASSAPAKAPSVMAPAPAKPVSAKAPKVNTVTAPTDAPEDTPSR